MRRGCTILVACVLLSVGASQAIAEAVGVDSLRALLAAERYALAERLGREALLALPTRDAADSLRLAGTLDALVEALWRGGHAGDGGGGEWAGRAVAIRERLLGPDHAQVAAALHNRANLLKAAGEYTGLRGDYERVIAIRERTSGTANIEVARALNDFGNLLTYEGDYALALSAYRRALPVFVAALGAEHRNVGKCFNNQAYALSSTGDYAGARALYEKALAIFEKALGPDHPNVALGLTNIANLCGATGDHQTARRLYERALAIHERAFGADHPDVAWNLRLIADLLCRSDDCRGAKPLYARALAIHEKTVGAENPEVAHDLNGLGESLRHENDALRARAAYQRALTVAERTLGAEHPVTASVLAGLADLAAVGGDHGRARDLHQQSFALRAQALGAAHPVVGASLERLALARLALGDDVQAFADALSAEEIGRDHFRLTARALAERQALRYAAERPRGLDLALSIAARSRDSIEVARSWDALIRSRALVLDEMAERRRALGGDSSFLALAAVRERLSNLTLRGPGGERPERYRALLERTRLEKEALERALSEKSLVFRVQQARHQVGLARVIARLPRGTALVAFAKYRRHASGTAAPSSSAGGSRTPRDGEHAYLAFVLPAGAEHPRLVGLPAAVEVDSLVARWTRRIAQAAHAPVWRSAETEHGERRAGEALRRAVWDPIAAELGSPSGVLIVPDGALSLMSFAALPIRDRYLIEDGPPIHYLAAERDIDADPVPPSGSCGILALGGPDFDAPSFARAPVSGAALRGAAAPAADSRGSGGWRFSPCGRLTSLRFEPLPAAASEARAVVSWWTAADTATSGHAPSACALSLTGARATEAEFKLRARGRRVLHLATHGFFLGEACAEASGSSRTTREPRPLATDTPLMLSGLALAGANRRPDGRSGEDGILTAEEIASLDLSGLEWAVLSACDTGLGTLEAGEGVLGLRRAFQVAGAQTVIMSLWPVEDESARRWMRALYTARLGRRLDTAAAVHDASLSILRARRTAGLGTSPVSWAGFVAVGEWR